jgi:hypothetical protein
MKKDDGSDVTDYSWRAPKNVGMTCWEKLHTFYNPKGLFGKNVTPFSNNDVSSCNPASLKFKNVCVGSDLNKRKNEALGLASKKRGRKGKTISSITQDDVGNYLGDVGDLRTV